MRAGKSPVWTVMEHGRTDLRKAGFSLVELLIALVLFGMIGAAATRFLQTQGAFMNRNTELMNTRQNVRTALQRIAADVKLVGQGLNFYDLQVPDLIVPNDGSVSVGSYTSNGISLISIPDPATGGNQLTLDSSVPNNGDAGSTQVVVSPGSNLSGLTSGVRVILFNPNGGDSQVVTLSGIAGRTLQFTSDSLVFNFPATVTQPSLVLKLNEVRYRVNLSGPIPFLERRATGGGWIRYVEGITNINFVYFDSNGNPFTPSTQAERRDIRRVDITATGIMLRRSRGGETQGSVTLTASAVPRNMLPAP